MFCRTGRTNHKDNHKLGIGPQNKMVGLFIYLFIYLLEKYCVSEFCIYVYINLHVESWAAIFSRRTVWVESM